MTLWMFAIFFESCFAVLKIVLTLSPLCLLIRHGNISLMRVFSHCPAKRNLTTFKRTGIDDGYHQFAFGSDRVGLRRVGILPSFQKFVSLVGVSFGTAGRSSALSFMYSSVRNLQRNTNVMGLFSERCENCGSYDTFRIPKDDPEFEQVAWDSRKSFYGIIKKLYKCRRCGCHVWYGQDGSKWYTYE